MSSEDPTCERAAKACRKCGEVKPLEEFYRCSAVKDGRAARCKVCRDAAHREYYAERADALRAYGREQRRRWTVENPERAAESNRRSRQEHPETTKRADQRKRQMRKAAGVPWGGATWERDRLVVLERDDGVCGICGTDVDPFNFTLDHVIPISRGGLHSYENCQLAHRRCNSRKHAHLSEAA